MQRITDIQQFYDDVCARLGLLRVRAVYISGETAIRGRYIQNPFPRIELVTDLYTQRTVHHELFHHVMPDLKDGQEFERLLDSFVMWLGCNDLHLTNTDALVTAVY